MARAPRKPQSTTSLAGEQFLLPEPRCADLEERVAGFEDGQFDRRRRTLALEAGLEGLAADSTVIGLPSR